MARLTYGLTEAKTERNLRYDDALFSESGPYWNCLEELDRLVRLAPQHTDGWNGSFISFCRLSVIHECEEAKSWLYRHHSGDPDYWHQRIDYDDQRVSDLKEAISAIDQLIKLDARQAYWIRQAFAGGLVKQAPKGVGFEATFNNPNHRHGGVQVSISVTERENLEPQFLMQAGLHHLDRVLIETRENLAKYAQKNTTPWRWVGNLYLDPPLSRRSKASIKRCGDEILGIATLGLSAALSSFFRLLNDGSIPRVRYAGTPIPSIGKPNWSLVADFVNAALPAIEPVSPEDLRQRWHAISKGRSINLHNWPGLAIRQSQLTE